MISIVNDEQSFGPNYSVIHIGIRATSSAYVLNKQCYFPLYYLTNDFIVLILDDCNSQQGCK